MSSLSVGFIGSGMMASAMMDGLISSKTCSAEGLICSDKYEPSLEKARKKGITATTENSEVCSTAQDAIILAVKPNHIVGVCQDIASSAATAPVVISVAAGVSLETLEKHLPNHRVVRVMPNTPALVGEGAAGYSLGKLATPQDERIVETIFGSIGICRKIEPEILLNAVTGLSGSGPAYVFQFIEALSDGGVRAGLPRAVATKLAAQTVKGAAEMVLAENKHPGELKDAVTSPGGTTIAGVEKMEQGGVRAATIGAVVAATKRSMQLGGISEQDIEHKYGL